MQSINTLVTSSNIQFTNTNHPYKLSKKFLNCVIALSPVFMIGSLILLSFLNVANASSTGTGNMALPYENWLITLQKSLTGPVAFSIALIGIVSCGATLILTGGEINRFMRSLIYIILVMTLLIGANSLMTNFFNGSSIGINLKEHTQVSQTIAKHENSQNQAQTEHKAQDLKPRINQTAFDSGLKQNTVGHGQKVFTAFTKNNLLLNNRAGAHTIASLTKTKSTATDKFISSHYRSKVESEPNEQAYSLLGLMLEQIPNYNSMLNSRSDLYFLDGGYSHLQNPNQTPKMLC